MELLQRLIDAGVLSWVDKLVDPELPLAAEAYVLRFERLTATIAVNADDDTVDIVEGERIGPSQTKSPAESAWGKAVGRPLRWGWLTAPSATEDPTLGAGLSFAAGELFASALAMASSALVMQAPCPRQVREAPATGGQERTNCQSVARLNRQSVKSCGVRK